MGKFIIFPFSRDIKFDNFLIILIDFPIIKIAEKYGRKKACVSLAVPQMIGWILIYFAQNPIWLIISRFSHGFAGGGERRITV
jgi:MFS family permease